jgi:anthranilate phosphoribosyltransferase
MSRVKQVRKDLGMQTFFNLLGPLINPASPGKQFLGVGRHRQIRPYQHLLQETKRAYTIVHSMDGYDEISLTGSFKTVGRDSVRVYSPEDIGMRRVQPEDIGAGDTIGKTAGLFLKIIQGAGTAQQETVVISNSAFAIQCARPELDLHTCLEMASDALRTGKAYQTLNTLIELS